MNTETQTQPKKEPIKTFRDLRVYNDAYQGSTAVVTQVAARLPDNEPFNLSDSLKKSAQAVPNLIAKGFARRGDAKAFRNALEEAIAEGNETIVSLLRCQDVYPHKVDAEACEELISLFDNCNKQLFGLGRAWEQNAYKNKNK